MKLLSKRFILIVVIVFVSALVLEGITRLFLSNRKYENVIPNLGQFDEILGWSKIPLARGFSSRTGFPIEYAINSKGLRDDETSYEKPDDRFRIVLLGDSYSFGWGVPIEKHFSTLLEGYFKNLEVINMGIDGFGIDQELIYLRTEGFRYESDLVLAYVPHYAEFRHMHSTRFGKNKPRFLLNDGELMLTNSPVVDNTPVRFSGLLRDFDRWLVSQSLAYQIFHDGLLDLIRKAPSVSQQKTQDESDRESDAFMDEMYALGEALVFAMHEDSEEHGATFVLVTHVGKLHAGALERNIYSHNVSEPLSNPAFSLPHDLGHINESGNGVLAWEIAKFLKINQLVPSQYLK